ncbi:MAG: molybdopterin-dependent oxidoreductase [Anaerovorax sp.]
MNDNRKKRKGLLLGIILVVFCFSLVACGHDGKETQGDQTIDSKITTQEGVRVSKAAISTKEAVSTKAATEKPATKEQAKTPGKSSAPKESGKAANEKKGPALTVNGTGVNATATFTLAELKKLKEGAYSAEYFALNNYGTKAYFSFTGVKVGTLLQAAGVKSNASKVTFIAEDGYKQSMPLEAALREDYIDEQDAEKQYPVIIAWNENGEEYRASDGLPFRMVIGQKAPGDINKPQWVSNVKEITVE